MPARRRSRDGSGTPTTIDEERIALNEVDGYCWHAYVPNVRPGQRYGYRVHGPWDPAKGLWCNPAKLLLDPYVKAVDGEVDWDPACFGYDLADPSQPNTADSARTLLGLVGDPFFDWANDCQPRHPMHETIIYETHVRGLTIAHPGIPEELRGTYAGVAHPVVIDHFSRLGVTAIELMPVHQFVHDHHLTTRGLRNYWGHNSIAYLAPHNGYAVGGGAGSITEFKAMVKALHAAGIEVILDVVYNHTAEGNHLGPTLSMRGVDNHAYYRLVDDDPRQYLDFTGTGNSLNARDPHVLQLIMDSLRYWVTEMHVDGFRFDLASTLAREFFAVDRLSAFFDLVQQDPVVSSVKLIAEPWDVGEGGYQVGNFPPCGRSGTAATATRSATSGAASRPRSASSASGSPAAPTCTRTTRGGRRPRSTSSPPTTGSRSPTSSPTTPSTTKPTARATATASRTTGRGTAVSRDPPTTPLSSPCASASAAT